MTGVFEILTNIGYTDIKDFGKEYRARPLYRPSDNNTSLCINKSTGEWYDFSERIGGSLSLLVQKTLDLPDRATADIFLGNNSFVSTPKDRYELTHIKKFDKRMLVKLQHDHEYWINRGIERNIVEQFHGGTTYNGRMAYRYVFPILNEKDELIGFTGRSLTDNPNFPKWKHLGSKTNWCYPLKWNADVILLYKEVILVESIGDMLALWQQRIRNVIVTFGVDISTKIIEFLLKIDAARIILAFNNDEQNNLVGNRAACDGRAKLLNFFDEEQVIISLPEEKDFGIMTPEQIDIWKQKNQLKTF